MFENKTQGERGGLVVECWTESSVPGFIISTGGTLGKTCLLGALVNIHVVSPS